MDEKKHAVVARNIGLLGKHFRHYCEEELEPFGLTNGLYFYLIYINYHPSCSLADVKEGLHVDKALVSRMVNKLCEIGYVGKDRREEDGRSYCLNLTEEGKRIFSYVKELPSTWSGQRLGVLDEEERRTFAALLQKVYDGIG